MSSALRQLAAPVIALAIVVLGGCETTTEINGQPAATPASQATPTDAELRKRATLRLQLATTYYQKGQFNIAIEEAQRAIQLDAAYADAYSLLGLISMDAGKTVDAETNFQRALQLDGDNGQTLNNYGWFLCQTGRERQSVDYFRRATASRSYQTPAMPMQNAGLCMLRVRDSKSAEEFFRKAFELDASNPVAKYHLSRLYLAGKQLERARFYYGLLPRGQDANSEVLWLGVRIARAEGDVRTERDLASELRRRFPDSREAAFLKREVFDE